MTSQDESYMEEAIELAALGRGKTSPNPMVGAIVVSSLGTTIGTGFHERAGGDHAEVKALEEAGELALGSTMYCTLEPCCHRGRTGPCGPRIVASGVERVVISMLDPNPLVNGRGVSYLRGNGLRVDVGLKGKEATRLNEAFITWVTLGRPFITMKIAVSLDGRIAESEGKRTTLTGTAANLSVHEDRAVVDGIGVGSTTMLVDDPVLTARGRNRQLPLKRIVFDRRVRTPATSKIFDTLNEGPVILMTTRKSFTDRVREIDKLLAAGAQVEPVASDNVRDVMKGLGSLGVTSLIVEGGATIHGECWKAGVVDRVKMFIVPVMLGSQGVEWLCSRESIFSSLRSLRIQRYGRDLMVEGDVLWTD